MLQRYGMNGLIHGGGAFVFHSYLVDSIAFQLFSIDCLPPLHIHIPPPHHHQSRSPPIPNTAAFPCSSQHKQAVISLSPPSTLFLRPTTRFPTAISLPPSCLFPTNNKARLYRITPRCPRKYWRPGGGWGGMVWYRESLAAI